MRIFWPKNWLFLLSATIVFASVAFFDENLAFQALQQTWALILKFAPIFVAILLLMLVSETLTDPRWIGQLVGTASGKRGWLIALVAGTLSPGPSHAWVVVLKDLRDKGMRNGLLAAFLFVRAVQLFYLPLLIHYFGWRFSLLFIAQVIAFALVNGLLVERFSQPAEQCQKPSNES